jgi:uncharacterized protein Yka (UPF0111/DUF47 family)/8-oxo-dGTP pyrophosphatase MutT (NUDIX family)
LISQFGVLAYDIGPDGEPRFLLITSRRTKRWVIPRGNPIPGLSAAQSAAQEAYEEAGLTGIVSPEEIGRYSYEKVKRSGATVPAEVTVFPLRASIQSRHWPERDQRESRWFTRMEAAAAVDEAGLKALIRGFAIPAAAAGRRPIALLDAPPPPPPRFSPLRLFKAMMPREDRFFDLFADHADALVGGADSMGAMLAGKAGIEDACSRIAAIDRRADAITRDVLLMVRRSFITPFDRSAITSLISAMDAAVGEMRRTAKAITLYKVRGFEPQMCEMAALAGQSARLVAEAVPLLRSLGRNDGRLGLIIENIVHLEGAADDLHASGLKALFQRHREHEPLVYFVGREVYAHLERVLDRLEDVADEMQGIMIDHA